MLDRIGLLLLGGLLICGNFIFATFAVASATTASTKHQISLDQKIGQMIMIGFQGQDQVGTGIDLAVATPDCVMTIQQQLSRGDIGGIILYGYNIANPQQLKTLTQFLTKDVNIIPFIAIDNEGGKVQRLTIAKGFADFPSAAAIALLPETAVKAHYAAMAKMIADQGVNFNFAPVVDLNYIDAPCPVIGKIERSYGDCLAVIKNARLMIEAMKAEGVLSCLKHWAGHGSALGDTHEGYVDVSQTFKMIELLPYRILCRDVPAVMTAHVFNNQLDADRIATFSPKIINTLLRRDNCFQGLVVTDDLHMGAVQQQYTFEQSIILAIKAGADVLLFSNNPRAAHKVEHFMIDPQLPSKIKVIIKKAIMNGDLDPKLIDHAYQRIVRAKAQIKQ